MAILTTQELLNESYTGAISNTLAPYDNISPESVLGEARTLTSALDSYNNTPRTIGATTGSIDTGIERLHDLYYQRAVSDTWVMDTTTATTSGLTITIDHADGTSNSISVEDMYNDLEVQKTKNEELEARMFKLEEHIRFLREI